MSDADFAWRQRLAPVRLVIETDFSADEVREIQRNLGRAAQQLINRGWSHEEVIKRYPAVSLVALVGHAALAYDHGAYWQSFWEELGLTHSTDFENGIRRQLPALLDKFSLARFPAIELGGGSKYVMTLALHAGIPIHCLRDLLEVINDHVLQGRPTSGAAVMEWLQEPGKEYRANALDVPVRNFLMNGAEFAADILDRIIEFIEEFTVNPALLDAALDSSTTGLPGVLLEELILQLKENPLHLQKRRSRTTAASHPAITYSIEDDEIVLALPTPSEGGALPWRVSFDGEVREAHALRRWGGDIQTAVARVAVPGPVREVVAGHPELTAGISLPLVLPSDPLLVFDANGRWIGRRDGLKDAAWAVFPDDHQLVDTRSSTPVTINDDGRPAGWHGWRSAFVELEDIEALQLTHGGDPVGNPRWVRKDLRPRFQLRSKILGMTATDGQAVYGTRPWVMLPATTADPAPEWDVKVRRFGDTEWIVDESWRSEDVETCVDPFDDAEESQLGLFEFMVTGPMGADARCSVFLAEGVDVQFDPAIRVPDSRGLTPSTAFISSDALDISPNDPINFEPRKLETTITIRSAESSAAIVLRPPHIEIRTGESGTPAPWRMSADALDPEDFAQDRFVAVRAPGVEEVTFGCYSESGHLLQVDAHPRRRHGDVFESRTQQFADTIRAHKSAELVATLQTGVGPVAVKVLSAQPRRLASSVELLGEDVLFFTDAAHIDDLAVYVWSTTAPWAPPEVLPLKDGRAQLPERLIGRGELRCQLFVDDPWTYIEPPITPVADAFHVEQFGFRDDGTPEQNKLSRFLGGPRSAPLEVGAVPEVWAALARLHADGRSQRFEELTALLAGDPRRALECLGDSTIDAADKMAMLIRSELVNHNFETEETFNELHAHPWFGCMVELADLTSLFHRRHEVRAERAETLAYLRERGGAPLMEMLQAGKMVHSDLAALDASAFALSYVPGNDIELKLTEIQQVPRAQLHPDSLRAGVYECLYRRIEWIDAGWSPNLGRQLSLVLTPIKKASQLAYASIHRRIERLEGIDTAEHPWTMMSVHSLTLALLARLEGQGRIAARYLNTGLLRDWSHLARLCPTMVANDVLMAEALVLYDRRSDLTGDDE
ncbi:hypothetical protein [Mycobacterium sp. ENV421]|uniref:hypothetical protein n=1 Tax=Mycobacterium sp. ENV421 TaxID=1213407 RepID=UPI001E5A11C0|nr:hypothetical protein [Mycobacterium sp. ENV421]